MGVGGDLFSYVFHVFLKGRGAIFFGGGPIFAKPPPPALNNERSLRKQKEHIEWMHDAHWCTVSSLHTSSP